MKESCESEDALALEKMKEAGVEVVELTPEAKDEFREAVKGVSEKYGNEINPDRYAGYHCSGAVDDSQKGVTYQ